MEQDQGNRELKRPIADLQDPDYDAIPQPEVKRKKVDDTGAKEATSRKICEIIQTQFGIEIQQKEKEIEIIDKRLQEARQMIDRLRACIVANYYGKAGQTSQYKGSTNTLPSIHPQVKQHLGKTVKKHMVPSQTTSFAPDDKRKSSSTSVFENEPKTQNEGENSTLVKKQPTPSVSRLLPLPTKLSKVKKTIIVGNISKYIPPEKREPTDQSAHKWMVYVRGTYEEPNIDHFVRKVWFFLHPSYRPNDLVEVSSPPFHLTRRGWGEFPLRVQLHFHGSRNKKLDIIHHLKLDRTHTGLQTLGAETIVEVEVDMSDIEMAAPGRTQSSQSSSSYPGTTIDGPSGEINMRDNLTGKDVLADRSYISVQGKDLLESDGNEEVEMLSNKKAVTDYDTKMNSLEGPAQVDNKDDLTCQKKETSDNLRDSSIDTFNSHLTSAAASTSLEKNPNLSQTENKVNLSNTKMAILGDKSSLTTSGVENTSRNVGSCKSAVSHSYSSSQIPASDKTLKTEVSSIKNNVISKEQLALKDYVKCVDMKGNQFLIHRKFLKFSEKSNPSVSNVTGDNSSPSRTTVVTLQNSGTSEGTLPPQSLLKGKASSLLATGQGKLSPTVSQITGNANIKTTSVTQLPKAVSLLQGLILGQHGKSQIPKQANTGNIQVQLTQAAQNTVTASKIVSTCSQSLASKNVVSLLKTQPIKLQTVTSTSTMTTATISSSSRSSNLKIASVVSELPLSVKGQEQKFSETPKTPTSVVLKSGMPVKPATAIVNGQILSGFVVNVQQSSQCHTEVTPKMPEKNILGLKARAQQSQPVDVPYTQDKPKPRVSLANVRNVEDLMNILIKFYPLIAEGADRNVHPYCAHSLDQWNSWHVGKRRAAEWQRAAWLLKGVRAALHPETEVKGEPLWSTKRLVVWCRHHGYAPLDTEITSRLKRKEDEETESASSELSKLSSYTDAEELLQQVEQQLSSLSAAEEEETEIDVVSVESDKLPKPARGDSNRADTSKAPALFVPSSEGAAFVRNMVSKIGVKLKPYQLEMGIYSTVLEDMIWASVKRFMDDLLRASFKNNWDLIRWPGEVELGNVYRAVCQRPEWQFLTNSHLGVPDSPTATENYIKKPSSGS